MSVYLKADRNLSDLDSVERARATLGLGSMALQHSNDVHITGGTVVLDRLHYDHPSFDPDATYAQVLQRGADGALEYHALRVPEWMRTFQNNVEVGGFDNRTTKYVRRDELAAVAFDGRYESLTAPFSLLSQLSNDVQYLELSNNLSDVLDKEAARRNLGIGDVGLVRWNDAVLLSTLSVSALHVIADPPATEGAPRVLILQEGDNRAVPSELPRATDTEYGVVRVSYDLQAADTSNTVPTTKAVQNAYNLISYKIDNANNEPVSDPQIETLVEHYGLLLRSSNFHEIDVAEMRAVLSLGSICSLNSGDDLYLNSLVLDSGEHATGLRINGQVDSAYLSVDAHGALRANATPPEASQTSAGMVYLLNTFTSNYTVGGMSAAISSARHNVVPSVAAVSQLLGVVDEELDKIQSQIPKSVSELPGFENFLTKHENLYGLTNPGQARDNLGLHVVAHTGHYKHIEGAPTALSEFVDDVGYLRPASNLDDITDAARARQNLGLGDLAARNSDDVGTLHGHANFETLQVRDALEIAQDGATPDMFLACMDRVGNAEWRELPKASTTRYGLVRIAQGIVDDDAVVASAQSLFELYQRLDARLATYEALLANLITVV